MMGNIGRFSKLQQRLRNIYLSRRWKKKNKKGKSVVKIKDDKVTDVIKDNKKIASKKVYHVIGKRNVINKNILVIGINNEVKNDIKISNGIYNKKGNNIVNKSKKVFNISNRERDLLKIEIINSLKNKFIEKEAELEVLESELFFIFDGINNSVEYKEIKVYRKKLANIIKEINSIIEQYNLYNDSYDMSNIVGIDDNNLLDNIINYRWLLDSYNDKKNFVMEYKLLNEFSSLYLKLEDLKVNVSNVSVRSQKVLDKFNDRDMRYEKMCEKIFEIKILDKGYLEEIERQDKYLDDLMKKLTVIDKEEYVTSHLVGLNELLFQSFKFIGLKILSPLAGFVPSIVGETMVTKNMIKNIYKGLHVKEVNHVCYSTFNFRYELNRKIDRIDVVSEFVDDTMKDLRNLKEDFLMIYDSKILGFDDMLKNINKMEENLVKNQYKINFIKNRLKVSKIINENKLKKVKMLNEDRS